MCPTEARRSLIPHSISRTTSSRRVRGDVRRTRGRFLPGNTSHHLAHGQIAARACGRVDVEQSAQTPQPRTRWADVGEHGTEDPVPTLTQIRTLRVGRDPPHFHGDHHPMDAPPPHPLLRARCAVRGATTSLGYAVSRTVDWSSANVFLWRCAHTNSKASVPDVRPYSHRDVVALVLDEEFRRRLSDA